MQELGHRLLEKNPRLREVEAQLKHLGGEMAVVKVNFFEGFNRLMLQCYWQFSLKSATITEYTSSVFRICIVLVMPS